MSDMFDIQPETAEQVEERQSGIRQDVADLLGNLGYELDSDDETFELLEWAFEPTPVSEIARMAEEIERLQRESDM